MLFTAAYHTFHVIDSFLVFPRVRVRVMVRVKVRVTVRINLPLSDVNKYTCLQYLLTYLGMPMAMGTLATWRPLAMGTLAMAALSYDRHESSQAHKVHAIICQSLLVPRHLSFGSRAFLISASKIWNSLPPHILQSQTLGFTSGFSGNLALFNAVY